MAGKIYKTAQGVALDIDHLRLINETVVAVGNMGVNSRGDRVNSDGSIKEHRNDIMKKTYRTNATVAGKGVINSQGRISDIKPAAPASSSTGQVSSTRRQTQTTATSAPTTEASKETTQPNLRGSLAQAINETAVESTVNEDSDLLTPSTNSRTITRI